MGIPYSEVIERMRWAGCLKNSTAIARTLNVTPQALSNYKKRGEMPTDLIVRFAAIHNLSMDWLIFGKGEGPKDGQMELYTRLYLDDLTPDEAIYIGKLLKVLRSEDKSMAKAARLNLDALACGVAA